MSKIKLTIITLSTFVVLALCFGEFSIKEEESPSGFTSPDILDSSRLGESSVVEGSNKVKKSTSEILDEIKKDLDKIKEDLDEILKMLRDKDDEKKNK